MLHHFTLNLTLKVFIFKQVYDDVSSGHQQKLQPLADEVSNIDDFVKMAHVNGCDILDGEQPVLVVGMLDVEETGSCKDLGDFGQIILATRLDWIISEMARVVGCSYLPTVVHKLVICFVLFFSTMVTHMSRNLFLNENCAI